MADPRLRAVIEASDRYSREFRSFREALRQNREALRDFGLAMTGVGIAIGGVGALGVKLAADMEQSRIAFRTMLGSAQEAETFLTQLRDFAKRTPFEFTGLQESAKRMMALGFESKQVIPTLTAVGDAVAALGGGQEMINRVTLALGQMQAKGKVSGEEMRQLAEAGIPAWRILAEAIGTDIPTAMKRAEEGAITASVGVSAIIQGMSAEFKGLMAEQSKTVAGQFSNLKDEATQALTGIGEALLPTAQAAVGAARRAVEAWNALPPVLQQVTVAATAAAGAMALLGGATLAAATQIPKMLTGLRILATLVPAVAAAVMSPVGLAAALGVVLVGALAIWKTKTGEAGRTLDEWADKNRAAIDAVKGVTQAVEQQAAAIEEQASEQLLQQAVKELFAFEEQLAKARERVRLIQQEGGIVPWKDTLRIAELQEAVKEANARIDVLLGFPAQASQSATQAGQEYARAVEIFEQDTLSWADALARAKEEMQQAVSPVENLGRAIATISVQVERSEAELNALARATAIFEQGMLSWSEAVVEAWREVGFGITEAAVSVSDMTEFLADLDRRAQDLTRSVSALEDADTVWQQGVNDGTIALDRYAEAFASLRGEAVSLASALGRLTMEQADAVGAGPSGLGNILALVEQGMSMEDAVAQVNAGIRAAARGTLRGEEVPAFDAGGVVPGPRGMPRLALLHAGETVLPTHREPGAGGVNVSVTINGNVGVDDLIRRIEEAVGRAANTRHRVRGNPG